MLHSIQLAIQLNYLGQLSSYPDPQNLGRLSGYIALLSGYLGWLSGYPDLNLGNLWAPICNIVSLIENIQSSMVPQNFGSMSQ